MDRSFGVLILGGGIMQIPAITTARQMGFTVLVADANPAVPGARLADYFEPVDLKDKDRMLELATDYRARGLLDGVFTAGTDFSSTVAYVAEHLGLPGIPYEAALNATDKGRMRAVLSGAGVPCPDFRVVTSTENLKTTVELLSYPLVVKPVDNMGARGVRRIDSYADLRKAVAAALGLSRSSRVIIEEYVDGPEFSVDALVHDGEITICGFADRHITFPPYFVEIGHTIPSSFPKQRISEMIEVFRSGVRAIGITVGAAKGDIKYSSRGPVIGEIAARLSGGYMSGWTFPYSSGVQLTAEALKLAVGLPPGDLSPLKTHTSAERAVISIPGTVRTVEGLSAAREDQNVKDIFLRVETGSRVVFPTNNVEKCGNIISAAEDRMRAITAAENAVRKIFIRLEASDEATAGFLLGNAGRYAPQAYTLTYDDNISALSRMPAAVLPETAAAGGVYPASHGIAVSILPLPFPEKEEGSDWHGKRFSEALAETLDRAGSSVSAGDGRSFALGSLFWRAFLRGGLQGGVWMIETAREALATSQDPLADLRRLAGG